MDIRELFSAPIIILPWDLPEEIQAKTANHLAQQALISDWVFGQGQTGGEDVLDQLSDDGEDPYQYLEAVEENLIWAITADIDLEGLDLIRL